MPNWCHNTLIVKKEHLPLIVNSKNDVDFDILAHMPASLNVDEAGGNNLRDIYVYLSNKLKRNKQLMLYMPLIHELFKSSIRIPLEEIVENAYSSAYKLKPDELDKAYSSGRVLVENYKAYGYTTWYGWCNANWGTKWNACDSDIRGTDEPDNDIITLYFDTPWCPPFDWLKTLIKNNVPFDLSWDEEGGQCGIITSDGTLENTFVANSYINGNINDTDDENKDTDTEDTPYEDDEFEEFESDYDERILRETGISWNLH